MDDFILVLIILILPYFLAKILLTRVIFARALASSSSTLRSRSSFSWRNILSFWSTPAYETTLVNPIVRQLFAATFTLSLDSLILVIFEIIGILDAVLRYYLWKFILSSLVILLVFILPVSCIFLIIRNQSWSVRMQRCMVLFFEGIFLYIFWYIGYLFPIIEHGEHNLFSLEGAIGRLGVAGVTTSAILSGYGAVATPRAYLAALLHHVPKHNIEARKETVRALFNRLLITKRKMKEIEYAILIQKGLVITDNTGTNTMIGHHNNVNNVRKEPTLDIDRIKQHILALHQSTDSSSSSISLSNSYPPPHHHHSPSPTRTFYSYGTPKQQRSSSWLSYIPLVSYFVDTDTDNTVDGSSNPRSLLYANPDDILYFSNRDSTTVSSSLQVLQEKLFDNRNRITNMEKLHHDAFLEYTEVINAQKQTEWSQTFRGQVSTLLGYVLSFYAIYKMFMALINIMFSRDPTKDPITSMFEVILIYLRVPRTEAALWVQPVSFVFIGILVFTSVRGFLLSFSQAVNMKSIQKLGGFSSVTSSSVILVFAQVMGMYFVSVLLLLRMSMPEEFRRGVTKAMGPIRFNFFHRWFDIIFLLSACITIIIFVLVFKEKDMTMHITDADRAAADALMHTNDADDYDDDNDDGTTITAYSNDNNFEINRMNKSFSNGTNGTAWNKDHNNNNPTVHPLPVISPLHHQPHYPLTNASFNSPTLDVLLRQGSLPISEPLNTTIIRNNGTTVSSSSVTNKYNPVNTSNVMSIEDQQRQLLFNRSTLGQRRK